MFDFSHLPQNATISEFIGPEISAWNKPPNATFVFMMCIGAGGNGGVGNAISTGGGGGGGGSGGITQALFLASNLPNTLYVIERKLSTPPNIFISNYPSTESTAIANIFIIANSGNAGNAGGGSSGGLPGSGGGSATVSSDMRLAAHALFLNTQAGRAGIAGSTTTASSQSIGSTIPILGGCGGSGNSNTGGGFTTDIPLLVPSISGGNPGGGPAGNGLFINRPFLSVGGMGGGGASSIPGGKGGTAPGYGAGGGGGGAGATTTSEGGPGGPAYACIIAW